MSKMQTFDKKQTDWQGLWWHPEYANFSSAALSFAQLRKFKGRVRMIVRKNKFYNSGQNNRPNYLFCLADSAAEDGVDLKVVDMPGASADLIDRKLAARMVAEATYYGIEEWRFATYSIDDWADYFENILTED